MNTYLTESEVAEQLKVCPRTLQRWRQTGLGLPFLRFGGLVRYSQADIETWSAKQTVISTSEVRQTGGRK